MLLSHIGPWIALQQLRQVAGADHGDPHSLLTPVIATYSSSGVVTRGMAIHSTAA
jgi:hypothetical protein